MRAPDPLPVADPEGQLLHRPTGQQRVQLWHPGRVDRLVTTEAPSIDGQVPRDREHPCPHTAPADVEAAGVAPESEEGLLRHLLGSRPVTVEDPACKTEDLPLEPAHQRRQRVLVAHRHQGDERLVAPGLRPHARQPRLAPGQ